jgi:hypothetical protein
VGEGYRWEKEHPELFTGVSDADVSVLFSRSTRDYYAQCAADYVEDYYAACLELMRAGVPFEVATGIPDPGRRRCLVLSGVACLSATQRRQIAAFLSAGGVVVATGPAGHYDERARPVKEPWLTEFGAAVEVVEPAREGSFPPGKTLERGAAAAKCSVSDELRARMRYGWLLANVGPGRLLWCPERMTNRSAAESAAAAVRSASRSGIPVGGLPPEWVTRQHKDGKRVLIHGIPSKVGTVLHPTLQNQFTRERVIQKLTFTALPSPLEIRPATQLAGVRLHSPDLARSREAEKTAEGTWKIDPSGVRRYFILEINLPG